MVDLDLLFSKVVDHQGHLYSLEEAGFAIVTIVTTIVMVKYSTMYSFKSVHSI